MIGYLALSILVALLSGVWALAAGFGVLAAFGFYALGGGLAMTAAVCTALYAHLAQQPNLMAA